MSYELDLINRARELQRLQTRARKLRRQLRTTEQDIRHVRKVLKSLQHASEGRRPDIAPSRLFNGVTGYLKGDSEL
jgi:prefoldin subunit 5